MPLTRLEGARLVTEASENESIMSPQSKELLRRVKDHFKNEIEYRDIYYLNPVESAKAMYAYTSDSAHALNYNNRGKDLSSGSNYSLSIVSSGRLNRNFSFFFNPQVRYPEDARDTATDGTVIEVLEGYGSLTFGNMELTVGRESLWWGPGYHGALLISNNAKPFDLIKITNPEPTLLPWLFSYLGPFKFTAFATRLESQRDLRKPYLTGLRLDLKPHPLFSVGLSRVAMFGGGGRKVDFGTVVDAFLARNENSASEPGNQLASVDVKLVIPWDLQPFVFYSEIGGEDEAGMLPSHIGYIAGVYLPRVIGAKQLALRGEYADNHVKNKPGVWYTHHIYSTGYKYKGEIIGHHMGSDARDIFFEATLNAGRPGSFIFSFDSETTGLQNNVKAKNRTALFSWVKEFERGLKLSAGYAVDWRKNIDSIEGNNLTPHSIWAGLDYNF
ncbi:MAG: capsule assembly Wzi family protein [Deltaproteobacteria bacterium]|nr:capsule assembly Wzi family protein [Deltaproteobacteria bacterium]